MIFILYYFQREQLCLADKHTSTSNLGINSYITRVRHNHLIKNTSFLLNAESINRIVATRTSIVTLILYLATWLEAATFNRFRNIISKTILHVLHVWFEQLVMALDLTFKQ